MKSYSCESVVATCYVAELQRPILIEQMVVKNNVPKSIQRNLLNRYTH